MSETMIQVKKLNVGKRTSRKRGVIPIEPPKPTAIIPPQERETRIDFTLDMVLNDLIQQGHLNPAKSYQLKTQEMKEHIGRMCDRVHRRKHGFPESDPVVPVKPIVKDDKDEDDEQSSSDILETVNPPLTIVKKKGGVKKRDSSVGNSTKLGKGSKKRSSSNTRKNKLNNKAIVAPSGKSLKLKTGKKTNESIAHVDSANLVVEPIDHLLMKSPISIPGAAYKRMIEGFDPEITTTKAEAQVYRASIDLSGFADDHISLELDDRRLIVVAQRPRNEDLGVHARKVIEIIDIPEGINLKNLKIGRGSDGSVLVEESSTQ